MSTITLTKKQFVFFNNFKNHCLETTCLEEGKDYIILSRPPRLSLDQRLSGYTISPDRLFYQIKPITAQAVKGFNYMFYNA